MKSNARHRAPLTGRWSPMLWLSLTAALGCTQNFNEFVLPSTTEHAVAKQDAGDSHRATFSDASASDDSTPFTRTDNSSGTVNEPHDGPDAATNATGAQATTGPFTPDEPSDNERDASAKPSQPTSAPELDAGLTPSSAVPSSLSADASVLRDASASSDADAPSEAGPAPACMAQASCDDPFDACDLNCERDRSMCQLTCTGNPGACKRQCADAKSLCELDCTRTCDDCYQGFACSSGCQATSNGN